MAGSTGGGVGHFVQATWVDLNEDDGFHRLLGGIRGLQPGPHEALPERAESAATERVLRGKVYHLGADNEPVPEAGFEVVWEETGKLATTDTNGFFDLLLPTAFQQGETVTLGGALAEQGMRAGGDEGERLLEEAVSIFEQALEVQTREHLPGPWKATYRNLGIALLHRGRIDEAESVFEALGEPVPELSEVSGDEEDVSGAR